MENEFYNVFNVIPGLVWTAQPDGNIVFLNRRWYDYTGLTDQQACGLGWQSVLHVQDQPEFLKSWAALAASGEVVEMEARLRRADGLYRWFSFQITPIFDESGQVAAICGLNIDIDERRRTDEVLRAQGHQLGMVVDGIPSLVTIMSQTGELQFANQHAIEYFGAPLDRLKTWESGATFHPNERAEALARWKISLNTGRPYEFEARQRRADGVYRWFEMRGFPVCDTEGHVIIWYLLQTDVDDRKQAEAMLAGERQLLDMVASGNSMIEILEMLCRLAERAIEHCYCSVLLLDPDGTRIEYVAAPSISESFEALLLGCSINADLDPCSTVARLKQQVVVADLRTDDRCKHFNWNSMAVANGFAALWSTPIASATGKILGGFTIYYDEPKPPLLSHREFIRRFIHVAVNVVERVQNVVALRASEARKAAILNSSLDCIVTMDHEGCITEFNPAAERTLGYKRGEILGRPLVDVIVPDSFRETHRRGLAQYLATGEAQVIGKRVEMTAQCADGRVIPVEIAITKIPLDGPPSFTCYLRDISEQRRSEQALGRSAAYLAEAQKLSQTGSFGWNVETDEHFWSDETFRIFEYDMTSKITIHSILHRIHPQDIARAKQVIALAVQGHDFNYECRLLLSSGNIKHVHIVAHGTRGQHGGLEYIGAVRDVTERRVSDEALSKVRSELAYVARVASLGALTASIAHEVNQPLAGIITNASTCLRMLAADPPNIEGARETARRTIRDGNRASDVITRLRGLFAKNGPTSEPVDLNEATREVVALSLNELQRSRVTVQTELDNAIPFVIGDRVQLQQVILNLLLNALDAMSGIDENARQLVIRTERQKDGHVRLSVQDAGVGFDLENLEQLFDAFYTTKSGGMGIGLSISRSIIEKHNGRLWAQANHGRGATFLFSLPCESQDASASYQFGVSQPGA